MKTYTDWFSVDVAKRASRVRGSRLRHVLRELLANSLDSRATVINLACQLVDDAPADPHAYQLFRIECSDNGDGCTDPEILRRVGSTTSDQSANKRGRFGQGLIDFLIIAEQAEIRTHEHLLTFETGQCTIDSRQPFVEGLILRGTIRHPGATADDLLCFFRSVVLPAGVEFTFNGELVATRLPIRTIAKVKLLTPLFDPKSGVVRERVRMTEVRIFDRFCDVPVIHELGIPVDEAPWSLPYDIDIQQKTPLDVDRVLLPTKYKDKVISELIGAASDLYAQYTKDRGEVPPEISNVPTNAKRLDDAAQAAIIETHLKVSRDKIVRRNLSDQNDRSESQELEDLEFIPVNRRCLPSGVSALLDDTPTVTQKHNEICKVNSKSDANLPPETLRQAACIRAFSEIASSLVGFSVNCQRFRNSKALATWNEGTIALNVDHSCLWVDPLGEEALGIVIHECAHAKVSGHCAAFQKESANLGARLALWVGSQPERWAALRMELYGSVSTKASLSPLSASVRLGKNIVRELRQHRAQSKRR